MLWDIALQLVPAEAAWFQSTPEAKLGGKITKKEPTKTYVGAGVNVGAETMRCQSQSHTTMCWSAPIGAEVWTQTIITTRVHKTHHRGGNFIPDTGNDVQHLRNGFHPLVPFGNRGTGKTAIPKTFSMSTSPKASRQERIIS